MPDFSRSARSVKRLNVSLIRSAAAWSLLPATTRPTTTRACETTKSPAMSRTSRCNRPIVTCRNGRMNHLIEIRNQTAKITFCREKQTAILSVSFVVVFRGSSLVRDDDDDDVDDLTKFRDRRSARNFEGKTSTTDQWPIYL